MSEHKRIEHHAMNGEPIMLNPNSSQLHVCCDCGLVHVVSHRVRIIKGKQVIEMISYRDDWETKIVRKRNKDS